MTQVLIMAGGRGERLRPLTDDIPKPLLPIDGKPIIHEIVDRFKAQGISNIFVSLGYLGDKIRGSFGDRSSMSFIKEDAPLGTGGPLALFANSFKPPSLLSEVIVTNGDILTNLDYRQFVRFHHNSGAACSIAACEKELHIQVPFGVLKTNAANNLIDIIEKPSHEILVSAGIYIFSRRALDLLPSEIKKFDMPEFILTLLRCNEKVSVFPIEGQWIDVGSHENYKAAQGITA